MSKREWDELFGSFIKPIEELSEDERRRETELREKLLTMKDLARAKDLALLARKRRWNNG
jgi:hypothetical protein